jgi:hypothetical protein
MAETLEALSADHPAVDFAALTMAWNVVIAGGGIGGGRRAG